MFRIKKYLRLGLWITYEQTISLNREVSMDKYIMTGSICVEARNICGEERGGVRHIEAREKGSLRHIVMNNPYLLLNNYTKEGA